MDHSHEPARSPGIAGNRRLIQTLAWGVHFYTALGLVIAAIMAVLLVQGSPSAFRYAFGLMLLASLVDATDGTLARLVKIKQVLPHFDGRKLDDITDFLTYTFLPLLLVWRAQLFPPGTEPVLLLPLLASAYGFCQEEAKTDDGYFLGFPSLWNVVALYLYVLRVPGAIAIAAVVVLAVLTFVPSRYLYPSQPGRLNAVSNGLAAIWSIVLIVIICRLPADSSTPLDSTTRTLGIASLLYPAFYMLVSWAISVKHWRQERAHGPG